MANLPSGPKPELPPLEPLTATERERILALLSPLPRMDVASSSLCEQVWFQIEHARSDLHALLTLDVGRWNTGEMKKAAERELSAVRESAADFLRAIDEQARVNADKARTIIDLYDALKERVLELTRSQFAVPLLDQIFERPLFRSKDLQFTGDRSPSRQFVSQLVRMLREDGILKVVREGRGRRAQVLAFAELINLCEGSEVF